MTDVTFNGEACAPLPALAAGAAAPSCGSLGVTDLDGLRSVRQGPQCISRYCCGGAALAQQPVAAPATPRAGPPSGRDSAASGTSAQPLPGQSGPSQPSSPALPPDPAGNVSNSRSPAPSARGPAAAPSPQPAAWGISSQQPAGSTAATPPPATQQPAPRAGSGASPPAAPPYSGAASGNNTASRSSGSSDRSGVRPGLVLGLAAAGSCLALLAGAAFVLRRHIRRGGQPPCSGVTRLPSLLRGRRRVLQQPPAAACGGGKPADHEGLQVLLGRGADSPGRRPTIQSAAASRAAAAARRPPSGSSAASPSIAGSPDPLAEQADGHSPAAELPIPAPDPSQLAAAAQLLPPGSLRTPLPGALVARGATLQVPLTELLWGPGVYRSGLVPEENACKAPPLLLRAACT
jgi:hypothetical protein